MFTWMYEQGIFVKVPKAAAKGIYIFKVKVFEDPDNANIQYGNTQKMRVTVK